MSEPFRQVAALLTWALAAAASAQPCSPYWTRVGGAGWHPIDSSPGGLLVWDDGTGAALYKSGSLPDVPGLPNKGYPVSRWNGVFWERSSEGMPQDVSGGTPKWLTTLEDASGAHLFFIYGTQLPTHWEYRAVRREGAAWVPTPANFCYGQRGFPTGWAVPYISYDDGMGPAIHGVGWNPSTKMKTIIRWNGQDWDEIGGTDDDDMWPPAMATYDHGSGNALYVLSDDINIVNGAPIHHLARWDGVQWSEVGGGGVNCRVPRAMCTYNDGTGEALYIADLTAAGGVPINHIGRWDGAAWSSIGNFGPSGSFTEIYDMAVFDDGSGPALFVGGLFGSAGGRPARNLAKWDGHTWTPIGPGMGPSGGFCVWDDGRGESLFISEGFQTAGGGWANGLVQYVGCKTGNCYADCNRDGALTVADFACFQDKFASRDPYANCNLDLNPGSLTDGLNLADFGCFITKFALGCP